MEDVNKITEELIKATEEYRKLIKELEECNPTLFNKFLETRAKCENLESAAKSMLRAESDSIDTNGVKFRVSTSSRQSLDLESVVTKAEGYGHIELLVSYGVLSFKGDASKIERLPEDIKGFYKKYIKQSTTKRITMPKELKRPW